MVKQIESLSCYRAFAHVHKHQDPTPLAAVIVESGVQFQELYTQAQVSVVNSNQKQRKDNKDTMKSKKTKE